jgi:hypothetical protein
LYIARDTEGFDLAVLRQGDILAGVPFPLMDQGEIRVLGEIDQAADFTFVPSITTKLMKHREDKEWTSAVVPIRFGFCAVVSNCCDLEPHGGRIQGHAILLARLQPIPVDIRRNQANFDSLRANKDPRNKADAGYMDFFYLESHEKLLNQDWRIHFNQIICLPTTDITLLLGRKVLQLDDQTRAKFKIKLGTKFMRLTEEELAAGLDQPWQAVPDEVGACQFEPLSGSAGT